MGDEEQIVAAERALRDREAGEYDTRHAAASWELSVQDACLEVLLELGPRQTVVDAGSGTGRLLPWLLEAQRHVIAVDHSQRSLEVAGERAPNERRLELRVGDLRALPVEDEVADRVVCAEVLQHIPGDEERLRAVRELHRVLRGGGLLALTAYRWRGHVKRAKEGFWGSGLYRYAFTVREMAALLRRTGFEDVTVGGAVILPALAKRFRMSAEAQRRLAFTPVGRGLAHYVVAGGRKP